MNIELEKVTQILKQTPWILNWGTTLLTMPLTKKSYEDFLSQGLHQDLHYLEKHLNDKLFPQNLSTPPLKSALVFTVSYSGDKSILNPTEAGLKHLKIARYAQGRDYHLILKQKLTDLIHELKKSFPQNQFLSFVDSGPVMERDLAYRAGLGWIGKNTCLIHPQQGSFFFICEIYTDLSLPNEKGLYPDLCGSCNRCVSSCPTGALQSSLLDSTGALQSSLLDSTGALQSSPPEDQKKSAPTKPDLLMQNLQKQKRNADRYLIPNLCISYWTIESSKLAPSPIREQMQDWLFGCDICQDVCPWNLKIHPQLKTLAPEKKQSELEMELRFILTSSNKKLSQHFKGTALSRAAGWKLKRNAIILIAYFRLNCLTNEICDILYKQKPPPPVQEAIKWCLEKLLHKN